MSAYTEQEELEKLKAWWKNYGGALVLGVVLGLGLLFGSKYWDQYQETRREAASNLYADMLQQTREAKIDAARASATRLTEDYASTPYAGMAALMLARLSFDAGDRAAARTHLQWAVDNARDPATAHAARLRLGRLLLDAREYDAALAQTQISNHAGFESEYAELRGDVYAAQGKTIEAREAYVAALKQLPADATHRRALQMKLDDVGGVP